MNILLILNINQNDRLEFATEVEDNDFIDLNNTFISVWLKGNGLELRLRPKAVGFDLYDYADHIQQCLDNKKSIPKELEKTVNLGLLWSEHTQKCILAEEAGKQLANWDWAGIELFFLENQSENINNCMTFLYNDEQGNIILETSSTYP